MNITTNAFTRSQYEYSCTRDRYQLDNKSIAQHDFTVKNCIKIATSDVMFQEEITEKAGQLPFPAQVKMISKTTQTDEWMDNTTHTDRWNWTT